MSADAGAETAETDRALLAACGLAGLDASANPHVNDNDNDSVNARAKDSGDAEIVASNHLENKCML